MSELNQDLQNLEGAALAADRLAEDIARPVEIPQEPVAVAPEVPIISPDLIAQAMPESVVFAGMAADWVEGRFGVQLSTETREVGAKKLAPLLVKYDFDSPFIRKWKPEIDMVVFICATGYGIFAAMRQAAKLEKEPSKAAE